MFPRFVLIVCLSAIAMGTSLHASAEGADATSSDPLDVLKSGYLSSNPTVSSGPSTATRGQFTAVNHTILAAGLDGKLASLPVRAGSVVRKGDLIARFSCKREQAEHEIALAKVSLADKNLEINKKLKDYQNISEIELAMSESELEIAEAESRRTASVLSECEVYAPFDATVTEKSVQAFQYVSKGEALVQLVGTKTLEVEMILPSIDINIYTKGRQFSIFVDETGVEYSAEIDRVVNVVDPVSQRVRVIGKLLEQESGLMPGMSGVVSLSDK